MQMVLPLASCQSKVSPDQASHPVAEVKKRARGQTLRRNLALVAAKRDMH